MKPKVVFFKKINVIDKCLVKFIKGKKRERAKIQMTNIKNERENIIIDPIDIKGS